MPQGTVTRLFKQRGIGFITPDESDRDVFIAMDTIPEVVASLMEGQRVVYDAIEAEGGVKAVSVSIVPEDFIWSTCPNLPMPFFAGPRRFCHHRISRP